ncbi:MAG: ATP-dependent DNA helicase RecG [Oscillospiraceae bacterium]|nr:ATP-dependent DNA helicase RecG [Oscillospiraceae bacterium]
MDRYTPLDRLPGIGQVRAKKLEKLGLATLGDVLGHYPQRYEDRRERYTVAQAPVGTPCCVCAMIAQPPTATHIRKGLDLVKARAVDDTGVLELTFFNQSYLKTALEPGQSYVFFGKVDAMGRRRSMTNPVFEREGVGHITGCILPIYPLTTGITNNLLSGIARKAVESCAQDVQEILPAAMRGEHHLCQVEFALRSIHFPADWESLELARRRLIFEELFVLTCGMALLKGRRTGERGRVFSAALEEFTALLPFTPTSAQRRAMEDMAADFAAGRVMNRLVQGDVGSGKTVVAAFGGWMAAKSGCQCAMMAPTELLAEQHARTLSELLAPAGVRVGLLTGSVKSAARKHLLSALAGGEIDLVVGTHALFSQGVEYADLGLVIADEQHRFGVAQRAALAAKSGRAPHVLVMSATPIPRTLALIIYGDLDVSVIDELPPGRSPVDTFVIGEDKRQRMYGFVRKQVREGRQVYIVCPSVEESEPGEHEDGCADLKAVTTYAGELAEQVFPDLRVGFVHGKMKAGDKSAAMTAFARGELDVLVSTTVIEVGVDVPNASLMVVENAERFGLSQLHQLRGRVGRGKHKSYCVLVSATKGETAKERLRTMCATNDGFRIAEEDLRLRGPGDFFGKRQHGLPQLKVADFAADVELLKQAKGAAEKLIGEDPRLEQPAHAPLKRRIMEMFEETPEIFN